MAVSDIHQVLMNYIICYIGFLAIIISQADKI